MENNQDIMVIGGFKEDVNAGLRKVCKDVEILNTERNVWRPGPKLNEAKSALACIKLDNQHLGFKWMLCDWIIISFIWLLWIIARKSWHIIDVWYFLALSYIVM